jgi:phospholipid/cholesterol/gamma-HCH transport system ATP-binding protein
VTELSTQQVRQPTAEDASPDGGAAERKTGPALEVQSLYLRRGDRVVFEGLSARFSAGKISVITGQSGSGKTTLLRVMACLLRPDRGRVLADGADLTAMNRAEVRAFRGRVGMLFQGGALLDSMTVFDNVALPLREHTDEAEEAIRRQVHTAFAAVDLDAVDGLLPGELSGGMVKRAGLARALIGAPDILLCDEPFSGLDPPTVRRVEDLLLDINRRTRATLILTSHHIGSTLRMADRIVMLLEGGAVSGVPRELLAEGDPRVVDFFGDSAAADGGAKDRE